MELDEQYLLRQLSEGSSHAFSLLFRHYYTDLVLFAGSYLQDQMTCEDIVQESFIKLWHEREEARKISSLRSFLLKSVQNRCFSHLRHEQIKNKYTELKSLFTANGSRETEEYIFFSELSNRLQDVLAHLSPEQRQCFEMNKMKGVKQAQIAQELNMPLRTVELRIAEALKILKQELKEYFVLVCLFLLP